MRFLFLLLIGYCVYLYFKGRSESTLPPPQRESDTETHRDPVCGIYVARDDAVIGNHEGQKLYFCSMACLEKYREQLSHKP